MLVIIVELYQKITKITLKLLRVFGHGIKQLTFP